MNPDPLSEEFSSWSPYNAMLNNPLSMIDPDGRFTVNINGDNADKATEELNKSTSLNVTRDAETGKLSATGEAKTESDKMLLAAINDENITVNVDAQSDNFNSDGSLRIGGSFMGNTVNSDGTVTANQEINPDVLGKMSDANSKPGADVLHEVTEAYQGAKISKDAGVSSPKAGVAGSVYSSAHSSATPQSGTVTEILTLKSGIQMPSSIYRNPVTGTVNYPKGMKGARWESNGKTIQRL